MLGQVVDGAAEGSRWQRAARDVGNIGLNYERRAHWKVERLEMGSEAERKVEGFDSGEGKLKDTVG